jgi:hypothetical protein
MNDSELDAKLKAAREPSMLAQYHEAFPQRVLANLRSTTWKPSLGRRSLWPRLVWSIATAACILIAFAVGHWRGGMESQSGQDVLANAKIIQETLAMFPNRVRAIVQDSHGLKLVLADQPEVPNSTPIYVRICDGENCSSLVTFSGQEIQIAGQKLTVLAQPDGGIILEGNQFVWSSAEKSFAKTNLKIEAKNLGPIGI